MINSLLSSANIWMILLSKASILLLNLLWSCSNWNVENGIVILLKDMNSCTLIACEASSFYLIYKFKN